jgi:hypothetical protein
MPNGATVPGTGFGRVADSAQCALLLPNCRDDGLGRDPWLVCVVVRDSRLPSITPVSALPVGRQSDDLDCRIGNRDGRSPSRGPDALSEVRLEVYVFWGVEISHSGRHFPPGIAGRLSIGVSDSTGCTQEHSVSERRLCLTYRRSSWRSSSMERLRKLFPQTPPQSLRVRER